MTPMIRGMPRSLSRLATAAGSVLDGLLPPACVVCRTGVPPGPPLCGVCEGALPLMPYPRCSRCGATRTSPLDDDVCIHCDPWPRALRRAASAVLHEPPASDLVAGLKYRGWTALAPKLAEYMVEPARRIASVPEAGGGAPGVLAVPLDRARLRSRGFNQSALLAAELASRTGWPLIDRGLSRRRTRRRQVRLGRAERIANVQKAFYWEDGVAPASMPVLLVDDVLTTGATAAACGAAIEASGGRCLGVVTFARSLVREIPG